MQVERRNGRAVVEHRDIVGKWRDDGRKARVDAHEHTGGVACDERNVAHVLNGIAEALLGIEHDGLAGERLGPGPLRTATAQRIHRRAAHLPAELVRPPAGSEVAHGEARHAGVELRFGVVGVDRDRLLGACKRRMKATEILQRVAAIDQCGGVPRRDDQHPLGGRKRFRVAVQLGQDAAAGVERVGRSPRDAQRPVDELEAPLLASCTCHAAWRGDSGASKQSGIELQNAGVDFLGFGELALRLMQLHRSRDPLREELLSFWFLLCVLRLPSFHGPAGSSTPAERIAHRRVRTIFAQCTNLLVTRRPGGY